MDYKGFATRKEAQAEANKMRGWRVKVIKMYLPSNPNADKDGNVWVIQCDSKYLREKYLHEDGFVR